MEVYMGWVFWFCIFFSIWTILLMWEGAWVWVFQDDGWWDISYDGLCRWTPIHAQVSRPFSFSSIVVSIGDATADSGRVVAHWALPPFWLTWALAAAFCCFNFSNQSGYTMSLKHLSMACLEPLQYSHVSWDLSTASYQDEGKSNRRLTMSTLPISEALGPDDDDA